MNAHDENRRLRCPVCLHRFETPEQAEDHLRKNRDRGHRAYKDTDEAVERRELQRRYQNARRDLQRRMGAAGWPCQ